MAYRNDREYPEYERRERRFEAGESAGDREYSDGDGWSIERMLHERKNGTSLKLTADDRNNIEDINKVFPDYEFVRKLGVGNSGAIYEFSVSGGHNQAVKVILCDSDAESRKVEERYEDMDSLENVPYLISVRKYKRVNRRDGRTLHVFAMKLMDGSVEKLLEQNVVIGADEAVKIAIVVCSALDAMFKRKKLIHGDIRPANILYVDTDEEKRNSRNYRLADFISAGLEEMSGSRYAAKRNISFENWTIQDDIYALGMTVMEILGTEIPSFSEKTDDGILWNDIPEGTVPQGILKICRKACRSDREDRYRNPAQMLRDLQDWQMKRDDADEIIAADSGKERKEKSAWVSESPAAVRTAQNTLKDSKQKDDPDAPDCDAQIESLKKDVAKRDEVIANLKAENAFLKKTIEEQTLKIGNLMKTIDASEETIRTLTASMESLKTGTASEVDYVPGSMKQFGHVPKGLSADGKQEMDWKVLACKGDRALLICDKALTFRAFHNEQGPVTWSESSLNKWLNSSFIRSAFSQEEQDRILEDTIEAEDNEEYVVSGGDSCQGKVFIFSRKELNEYIPEEERRCRSLQSSAVKSSSWSSASRAASSSRGSQSADDENPYCKWWLRTPGNRESFASFVDEYGKVMAYGREAVSSDIAVRPAVWVRI